MSIYISYHYPCVDGAFSAMNLFLALKAELDILGNNSEQLINDLISKIDYQQYQEINKDKIQEHSVNQMQENQVNEDILNSEDQKNDLTENNLQEKIKEEEQKLQKKLAEFDLFSDENKPYFYTEQYNFIRYLPYTHSVQGQSNAKELEQEKKKIKKQKKQQRKQMEQDPFIQKIVQMDNSLKKNNGVNENNKLLSDSIIFLVDFSLPIDKLKIIANIFKKVIIIDHHIHAESYMEDLKSVYQSVNEKYQKMVKKLEFMKQDQIDEEYKQNEEKQQQQLQQLQEEDINKEENIEELENSQSQEKQDNQDLSFENKNENSVVNCENVQSEKIKGKQEQQIKQVLFKFNGKKQNEIVEMPEKEVNKIIQGDNQWREIELVNNVYFLYDKKYSGCTLAKKFCDDFFQIDKKMPKSILEKLKQLNIYVQDYDIKTKVHKDSEAFVAGLYSMKIQLNAKVNPVLFHNFLCYPTEQMIHKGRLVLEKVEEDVKNLLDKKKDIIYFGGKLNPIAKCYAIKSKDTTLYNTLGAQLSLASLKDGLDHMGAVYSDSSQGKKLIKVSLRASLENFGICNVVASKYGGGGHERAASFFISSDTFRQWLK